MIRVKICGIKNKEELKIAVNAGAHAVGFITEVALPTPRKISLAQASNLISKVPIFVTSVIVIMPENSEDAIEMINKAKPSAVQIHNNLKPIELKRIKEATKVKLIKTIAIPKNPDYKVIINEINQYIGVVDGILLDTLVEKKIGGSGVTHDWSISSEIVSALDLPVILAGGLNPDNVKEAIKKVKPYGVDVASGVETNGRKDENKVMAFIRNTYEVEV